MAELEILITPGLKDLVERESSVEELADTLAKVDRDALIRHSVRVLNGLAADRHSRFADDQEVFLRWLPADVQAAYWKFVRRAGTRVRFLHPAQQLILVHAAARYAKPAGGLTLGEQAAREAWALACLQINDQLMKAPVPTGDQQSWEKALYLFSEDAGRWELMNPSRPDKSLARLRALFKEIPTHGDQYAAAADRLCAAFLDQLGLDFDTAFSLTAFLILHWVSQSAKLAEDPDAALINRRTWLKNSSIPLEDFDRYLGAVALRVEDIPPAFDALNVGMSFREVLPFRRCPLLRVDDDGVAFLSPQFVSEKGGVDLLWLLTNPPGGVRETRMWTDDFGVLYERYVRSIFEGLGTRLGGEYVPDLRYDETAEDSGQIDGLVKAGNVLAVIEVKASLIRQKFLAHGTVDEVREDLDRKFVGDLRSRKGVSQIVHAIHWLAEQRRCGRQVQGIDLRKIDTILPVLVVADRHLRYPGVGQWFDYRLQEMLRPVWARVTSLLLCGTEDIENLEHLALKGDTTVMESLITYARRVRRAAQPLWMHYQFPRGPHPRFDRISEAWFKELVDRRIMLR